MRNTGLRRAFLASVLLLFLLPTFSHSEDPASLAETLDRYISARTALGRFSGAVLVAKNDRILYRKGYGFADVSRRLAYTPETRQAVASITKMFTSMAALKMRDAGRLRLDDPICAHVDACPDPWKAVTVQQLMRHTSGIPDYEEPLELGSEKYLAVMTQNGTSRRLVEDAKKRPLDFPPGTKFHYSNTGYLVLAGIVERVAGRPFNDVVTGLLLKPAGMARAGMFDGQTVPEGLATGYTHPDLGWARLLAGTPLTDGHLLPRPRLPLTPPAGDAGLYATVDDLLAWSRVMDGSALVPKAEADEVFTPGLEEYGYGWFSGQGFRRRRFRHTGAGLIPLSPTHFYFPLGDGTATFVLGEDGTGASVNIHYGGEDHVAKRLYDEPGPPPSR